MDYFLHILILVMLYTMLSQSLNIAAGFTGLVSLAQAGFYGIGAYTTAILSVHFHLPFWLNLPVAIAISAAIAYVVSVIALKTAEDYFIICTLGIQVIIFSMMNNWMELTNGPLGISAIPAISLFGIDLSNKISFLFLCVAFAILIWYLIKNISRSAFGTALKAISEDEILSKSIGKNVYSHKATAFTMSAAFAAIPGALYAHYISYIDPSSFTISESIFILSIVIIGGLGSIRGAFFASLFLICLPEILRFVGLPNDTAANLRQIIYGSILVLIIFTGRNGLSSKQMQANK